MKIEQEMTLKSNPMLHAAGVVRWLRAMYAQQPRKATKLMRDIWPMESAEALQILKGTAESRTDVETGDLTVVVKVDSSKVAK